MRYAYFPGCVGKDSCSELDASVQLVTRALDLDVVEMESATCCGAGFVQDVDPELALALNARTFAQAEQLGLDVMTVCSTCQYNLAEANRQLQDPKVRARVNEDLAKAGLQYNGGVQVKHMLYILLHEVGLDNIRRRVKRPLSTLRIAPFYGCQLLRPSALYGLDDPDKPAGLEQLIEALGGVVVDYEERKRCCGFPITFVNEKASMTMNAHNMSVAKKGGANVMVTPCPLCHLNMDMYQPTAEKTSGERLRMPILHMPQLIGLALGIEPRKLKLQRHVVSTRPVVAALKA